MAQTGFTPIQLYHSTTASAVPTAGNLQTGELAANVTDRKLYSKNGAGTVVSMAVSPAGDTMTGPLAQAAGTAALPSYTFSGDLDTGIYSPGANLLALTTNATDRLIANASGVQIPERLGIGSTAAATGDKLLVTQGADFTIGTDYAIRVQGSGYTGAVALNATSMQIGHNSASRSLTFHSGTGFAERMSINGSTGNITFTGTMGAPAGTVSLPSYTFSGDTNTGMWSPGADILAWSTAGAERLRIDTSGNVGVGVTPSAWNSDYRAIDLGANGSVAGRVGASNTVDVVSNAFRNSAGNWIYKATNPAARVSVDGSSGSVFFFRAASGTAGNTVTWVDVLTLTSTRDVLVTGSGGLGYGVGSGGTVTQATSKSTAVTLNKPSGQITTNASSIAAGGTEAFLLNNTLISSSDTICCSLNAGAGSPGSYRVKTVAGSGVAIIYITNESGGALAEAIVINFVVIKGATT